MSDDRAVSAATPVERATLSLARATASLEWAAPTARSPTIPIGRSSTWVERISEGPASTRRATAGAGDPGVGGECWWLGLVAYGKALSVEMSVVMVGTADAPAAGPSPDDGEPPDDEEADDEEPDGELPDDDPPDGELPDEEEPAQVSPLAASIAGR